MAAERRVATLGQGVQQIVKISEGVTVPLVPRLLAMQPSSVVAA